MLSPYALIDLIAILPFYLLLFGLFGGVDMRFLRAVRLLRIFKGDVSLAVAAYNAGENAVKRHQGIPPYSETLTYVGKVLGLRNLYARELPLVDHRRVVADSGMG